MQQTWIERPEIKLIGISVRTTNAKEADSLNGNIFPIIRRYFHEAVFNTIPNRTKPGTTFCAYSDYENGVDGEYTYYIGEEVESFDGLPAGLNQLTIPAQRYAKFTTKPAPMPEVIRDAWYKVWVMSDEQMGGKRNFATDFEIYDERAADHQNIVLDLCIGIH